MLNLKEQAALEDVHALSNLETNLTDIFSTKWHLFDISLLCRTIHISLAALLCLGLQLRPIRFLVSSFIQKQIKVP